MTHTENRAAQVVAIALLATVVTQILYMVLRGNGVEFESGSIWIVEAVAFLAVSVCALAVMSRVPVLATAAAALALGGLLNVVQVGMGLAMFGPLSDAGEAMAAAYSAVLAGAFWLYFAGKALFGVAGILLGVFLFGQGGTPRIVGALAALTGLAAVVINIAAMRVGMDLTMPAGAAGTAATLFAAIALPMAVRRASQTD